MTTTTFSSATGSSKAGHRPVVDIAVERVALGLLRWSKRRAEAAQPSHERMALLRENEASIESRNSAALRHR